MLIRPYPDFQTIISGKTSKSNSVYDSGREAGWELKRVKQQPGMGITFKGLPLVSNF